MMRFVNSLISSSVNFMPAMPLRAVNSLSSAKLSLTLVTSRWSVGEVSRMSLTMLQSSSLSLPSTGHFLLAAFLSQAPSQPLCLAWVPRMRPESQETRSHWPGSL